MTAQPLALTHVCLVDLDRSVLAFPTTVIIKSDTISAHYGAAERDRIVAVGRLCRVEGKLGTMKAVGNLVVFDIDPVAEIAASGKCDDHLKLALTNGAVAQDRLAA